MLFNTPFGYVRWEPLRWLKSFWVWLDSPPEARLPKWSNLAQRHMQVRDFTDSELMYLRDWPWAKAELHRRSLPFDGHWVDAVRDMYPDISRMRLAEKMFRPES